MTESATGYARARRAEHLARLKDWLCIPSVSTLSEHAPDVRRAAAWAADYLFHIGIQRVEVIETTKHPVVYAEWLAAEGAPTLLVYGHFDVQPPDPLEEWHTPPFEPQVVGEDLYGRGASDDKGQLFAVLAALEAHLKSSGGLPVNVKLLLEGEEEVMSPNLADILRTRREALSADVVLICDQEMIDPQTPVIMYGVRGNLYLELTVHGPGRDLHSGTFGGAVDNPMNVLVRMLAALQDGQTRRVKIPGFYERVQEVDDEQRMLIAQAPINDEIGLHLTGAPELGGEQGYSLAERISVRPTLEIHGIMGGFAGEGSKTVIPADASAKISVRLVPDQDPEEIARLFERYLRELAPPTVTLDVRELGSSRPVVIDHKAQAVQSAARAYELGFGNHPVYFRGGGSLPIVSDMIEILSSAEQEIPVVMMGFGLPDGNTHAPNEKIHLPNFYRGIETIIHYLDLLAEIPF